jgi:hypothetical protein
VCAAALTVAPVLDLAKALVRRASAGPGAQPSGAAA